MEELPELSPMELDALGEMGNVGTGNAATALSKLLNRNVEMNIPESAFIPVQDVPLEVGGPEEMVASIYMAITGDLAGEVMFLFPIKGAYELTDLVMGQEPGTTKSLTGLEESAFKEVSNILTGAFLNALAMMLDSKVMLSIPHIATDMAQSVLDFLLIQVSWHADSIFCIKTKINVEGHDINGNFMILFDKPSLKNMVKILHSRYGDL